MSSPRHLGRLLPTVAGKALARQGVAFGTLVSDWAGIVGAEIAAHAVPLKLQLPRGQKTGAVLHLLVAGPWALQMQHAEPQIIERINGFFGYAAVGRLKFIHAAAPARRAPAAPARPLTPTQAEALAADLSGVEDPELRQALEKLGRHVRGRA